MSCITTTCIVILFSAYVFNGVFFLTMLAAEAICLGNPVAIQAANTSKINFHYPCPPNISAFPAKTNGIKTSGEALEQGIFHSTGAFGSTSGGAFGSTSGGAFGSTSGGAFGSTSGGAFGSTAEGVVARSNFLCQHPGALHYIFASSITSLIPSIYIFYKWGCGLLGSREVKAGV